MLGILDMTYTNNIVIKDKLKMNELLSFWVLTWQFETNENLPLTEHLTVKIIQGYYCFKILHSHLRRIKWLLLEWNIVIQG